MSSNLERWILSRVNFRNSEVTITFEKNCFHFEKHFCQQDRAWPHTVNAMLRMLNENCNSAVQLAFLNSSDMGVPGHHTLPIWTNIIISYKVFWMIQFTQSINTQWKKCYKKFCQGCSGSVTKLAATVKNISCWLQMIFYTGGAHTEMSFCDCQSPKTTELTHQIQWCLLCSMQ
jgi:hypothetical protein